MQIVVNQRVMAFNTETALGIIKNGISSRAIDPLSEFLGIGKGQVVEYLDLDRTTALRRATKDQPLPTHSAESVLRLLELDEIASDTFESEEAASGWLRRSHPMLDGESPLQAARTSFGAQRVKDILLAIKYGGVV
jgi:putative toxin-antitoxin system antitoxin component (TIGR02293 family)